MSQENYILTDLRQQFRAKMTEACATDINDVEGFAKHVEEAAKINDELQKRKPAHC